jgi:hypothetical protein
MPFCKIKMLLDVGWLQLHSISLSDATRKELAWHGLTSREQSQYLDDCSSTIA